MLEQEEAYGKLLDLEGLGNDKLFIKLISNYHPNKYNDGNRLYVRCCLFF